MTDTSERISRKRTAEKQLTRDSEETAEPQAEPSAFEVADAATLAQRKLFRAKKVESKPVEEVPLFEALKRDPPAAPTATGAATFDFSWGAKLSAQREGLREFSFGEQAAPSIDGENRSSSAAAVPTSGSVFGSGSFSFKPTGGVQPSQVTSEAKPLSHSETASDRGSVFGSSGFSFKAPESTPPIPTAHSTTQETKPSLDAPSLPHPSSLGSVFGSGSFSFKGAEGAIASRPASTVLLESDAARLTGEEDETCVFEGRCRVYRKHGNEWTEFGRGPFKLNELVSDPKRSRIVMREEKTKKVLLNEPLGSGFKLVCHDEAKVVFTALSSGEVQAYLLKGLKTDEASKINPTVAIGEAILKYLK